MHKPETILEMTVEISKAIFGNEKSSPFGGSPVSDKSARIESTIKSIHEILTELNKQ